MPRCPRPAVPPPPGRGPARLRRAARIATTLLASLLAAACAGPGAGAAVARGAASPPPEVVVLRAGRLYVSPDQPPIDDAVLLMQDGRVRAVGRRDEVAVPAGATESACSGPVATAGFQNSHVHLIGPAWEGAARRDPAELARHLDEMLGRWGFTTVVDLASARDDTLALRARIERGELPGPRILTAGWALFPEHGLPVYIAHLPPSLLSRLPQPATPEAAAGIVRDNVAAGADVTKLFIVTPQGHGRVKTMAPDIARAAVDASHRAGRLVFVHPTSFAGAQAALDAGADVLAHDAFDDGSPWPPALLRGLLEAHVAMVPTLQLLPYELAKEKDLPPALAKSMVDGVVAHVRAFAAGGGQVLFGTDVGYMDEVDPTDEYRLMARAGLSPLAILASLTTAPAARFHESDRRGRLAPGQDADVVVLEADPATDVANFARVRCTLRAGKPLHVATH